MVKTELSLKKAIKFKTPLDYWKGALDGDEKNINRFPEIQKKNSIWLSYDNDLHIYPYVQALPAILTMGCHNKCYFCPTAEEFGGKVVRGDPEIILPYYKGKIVHFMDENFFENNDMTKILPLLKKFDLQWLAMSTAKSMERTMEQFGEKLLWESGLRIVEVGLENICLMNKVRNRKIFGHKKIATYLLNMTFLPKETKETIKENSRFMRRHSLIHPIHFNNGLWFAPGQFYYPYEREIDDGIMVEPKWARTQPTYIPNSFLKEEYEIKSLERVNYFNQLVYDFKLYPKEKNGLIGEFIGNDFRKAMWMVVGIRSGGIT